MIQYALYGLSNGSRIYEIGIRYYSDNPKSIDNKLRQGEIIIDCGVDINHLNRLLNKMIKTKDFREVNVFNLTY